MTVFHRNETREPLPAHLKGGVIAIGNFDGVHRGHQSVLNRALEISKARGIPALVLTFEPHPRTVFRPQAPVFRLTPAPLKARILEALGFGAVIEYPFDYEFSQRSADDFIHSILKDWLGASEVVTGFDFHFGRGREGGPAFLMNAGN
ncbi:bifunctional riboflavin kinase/FAD synthetase, partial [Rhizobium ruizarguesonis]